MVFGIKSADCIECYACGLAVIDPIQEGHVYNLDPDDPKGKMFNETCVVFDSFLLDHPKSMDKWIRPCPDKVESCFWAKGEYNGESKYS